MSPTIALSLFVLWAAVLTLASLVLRMLGIAKLRHYPLTSGILVLCLIALPSGYFVKTFQGRAKRVFSLLRPYHSQAVPVSATCGMFPEDNILNARITALPVDPHSQDYIAEMGPDTPVHPDFGSRYGYEYAVIADAVPVSEVTFTDSASESDPGPYRIPEDAPVEPGSDAHVLVLDQSRCKLYELFAAKRLAPQHWQAGSGAIFDLRSNKLRPADWTSADAAGLAILPGLVRYDEVAAGVIRHALRFTTPHTRNTYVWPARHRASSNGATNLPPMGQRFRLKASLNLDRFSPDTRVILQALKDYGMLLADNGGPWFLSGARDSRWPRKMVDELRSIHGADFEAIDTSGLRVSADSGSISH